MGAFSFCEHLDYPNYPRLFQTKEDNNNEEAQSPVPENHTKVAAFSHNKKKKIIKTFKWHLFFPVRPSPLHVYQWKTLPSKYTQELMGILLWPNDAERNWQ